MRSPEALLDTSVWVALFQGDDRVEALRSKQADRHAVVSVLVLAELRSLASQGRLRVDVAEDVHSVARVEPLLLQDALAGGELHGRLRAKGLEKVSLADALILATARRLGMRLLTLDKDLQGEPDVEILG